MEGRLPFDPAPANSSTGRSSSSKAPHRIARCEWYWWKHGDVDGAWNSDGKDSMVFQGARELVEGLLKKLSRGRMSLDAVAESKWVADGIAVPGGCLQMDDGSAAADSDVSELT